MFIALIITRGRKIIFNCHSDAMGGISSGPGRGQKSATLDSLPVNYTFSHLCCVNRQRNLELVSHHA